MSDLLWECVDLAYYQRWPQSRNQDTIDASAQHGHTTYVVRTSALSAAAFRGVWRLLPQKILEFYSIPGQF